MHHPLSETISSDDKIIDELDLSSCYGLEYIATIKMDGECSTIYPNGYTHARSIDSKYHKSRGWINSFAASIGYLIPSGLRVCGEYMFAKHSIKYENLPSFFLGFGVWSDDDVALAWDETLELFETLGVTPVQVVWRGILTEQTVEKLWASVDKVKQEGLVFRPVSEVSLDNFSRQVFKLVRENHVQSEKHWMYSEVEKNELKIE